MVTKESLELQYAELETENLLVIIAVNSGYTELAVGVALAELKKRNVAVEEIKLFQSSELAHYPPSVIHNYLDDLSFIQKAIAYLLFIPRFRSVFLSNLQQDGYILKSQQANYYSLCGFIVAIIAMASSNLVSDSAWLIWMFGFPLSYIIDISYNKERQVKKLEQIMAEGGDFNWD